MTHGKEAVRSIGPWLKQRTWSEVGDEGSKIGEDARAVRLYERRRVAWCGQRLWGFYLLCMAVGLLTRGFWIGPADGSLFFTHRKRPTCFTYILVWFVFVYLSLPSYGSFLVVLFSYGTCLEFTISFYPPDYGLFCLGYFNQHGFHILLDYRITGRFSTVYYKVLCGNFLGTSSEIFISVTIPRLVESQDRLTFWLGMSVV